MESIPRFGTQVANRWMTPLPLMHPVLDKCRVLRRNVGFWCRSGVYSILLPGRHVRLTVEPYTYKTYRVHVEQFQHDTMQNELLRTRWNSRKISVRQTAMPRDAAHATFDSRRPKMHCRPYDSVTLFKSLCYDVFAPKQVQTFLVLQSGSAVKSSKFTACSALIGIG
jgi:hypothetical protein